MIIRSDTIEFCYKRYSIYKEIKRSKQFFFLSVFKYSILIKYERNKLMTQKKRHSRKNEWSGCVYFILSPWILYEK